MTVKIMLNKKTSGTITVFLSLILLLVLSLLCTIIEAARINTAKVYAERALSAAMDSALAGYYAPLWNEYHIFALNTGSSDYNTLNAALGRTVNEYMTFSIDPANNDTTSLLADPAYKSEGLINLLDIDIDKLTLQNPVRLMDYEGELFINQAVQYMKYDEVGSGLELLLSKLSLLEQPAKVSYIMEEKQKVEEELVEIDEEILKLMELFDGLKTGKKGLELNKDGSLKTCDIFIKKLCYVDITMDGVGINNVSIFQAQKDKYINPSTAYFAGIDNSLNQIEALMMSINDIQAMIIDIENKIRECEAKLSTLKAKSEKTASDRKAIKALEKMIKDYSADIDEQHVQIEETEELINAEKGIISRLSKSLIQFLDKLQSLHDDAIKSVNKIIKKTKEAAPLIDAYQELLYNNREELSQEIFEGLDEELEQLKKYTSPDENSYDFPGMLQILERNKQLLTDVKLTLRGGMDALDKDEFVTAAGQYAGSRDKLVEYQIDGLTLDYSTLVYDKSGNRDVLDKVNSAIKKGFVGLVLASEEISEAVLDDTDNLPSFIHALNDEKSDFSEGIGSFFNNAEFGDKSSKSCALFGDFNKETDIQDMLTDGINKLAELLLFREYLNKHFSSYQPKSVATQGKPTAVKYEQEYLLMGKNSDTENLSSVITRIIMIRMIFDFIAVISDKSIRNEANLIASALVGFTGLPILVKITQMLIMLLWSFAEALLDTTAILMGKDIPIIKKNVVMTFPEIFLLTNELLSKKAASLEETKELSLNYDGYLKIFLFLSTKEKLAYRAMDLIQENLKLRYKDNEFKINNCLYGFEMSAQFGISRRFTSIDFLSKYFNDGRDSYQFSIAGADSY